MGFVVAATFAVWLLVVIIALGARPGDEREQIVDPQLPATVNDTEENEKEHQP